MPITKEIARDVIDAARTNGRQVTVTLRPALERATADLTRAQAALTRAQAVLEHADARHAAAELAPATVWIGTAQFDPNSGGGVTIVDATRIAGEPLAPGWAEEGNAADKGPVTVMFGLEQITTITEASPADSDLDYANILTQGDERGR